MLCCKEKESGKRRIVMVKSIKILTLIAIIMAVGMKFDSWGAGRWEKQLKLTGNYNGTADDFLAQAGVNGSLIRQGITSKWVNQLIVKYSGDQTGSRESLSYWTLVEEYKHNISAFNYLQIKEEITDIGLKGENVSSKTKLVVGRYFSRFLGGSVGLRVDKNLVPEGEPSGKLTIGSEYNKSLGYRTKFNISPTIYFDTKDLSKYDISANVNLTYKFGQRISFSLYLAPSYNSQTNEIGNWTSLDLVYDLFMY
jgi:hypothetical protein